MADLWMGCVLKNLHLTFHFDGGHGWLKVDRSILRNALLARLDISQYSYVDGTYAYLEEDCDAPLFIETMNRLGVTVTFSEKDDGMDSFIRNLSPYPRSAP